MELLIAEERKIWRKSYGFWILLAVVILKLVSLEIEVQDDETARKEG